MTISAIYARKSTDQGNVADESKSVTRQIAHPRQYAAAKGWTVADEHIYVDDGISTDCWRVSWDQEMMASPPRQTDTALDLPLGAITQRAA